ncbi:MAG: ASKHA domain-containing protein [Negativicutes bacterium]|nr:ASKHA domain-containing protein [Negativicutes bacterium]
MALSPKDRAEKASYIITVNPGGRKMTVAAGVSLKEVLAAGQLMPGGFLCGGNGTCGKCVVYVRSGQMQEPTAVLACQTRVAEDMEVLLDHRQGELDILVTDCGQPVPLEPAVGKRLIELEKAADHRDSWESISSRLAADSPHVWKISLNALRQLALLDGSKAKTVTAVTYFDEVIAVEAGDTAGRLYGMAFDIGTTTIAGYLYDLTTGARLTSVSSINGQTQYGADVISRIVAAESAPGELEKLQAAVIDCVNRLMDEACGRCDVSPSDVYDLVLAGNTCMHHLFFAISPSSLGRAPYKPIFRQTSCTAATGLGVAANSAAQVCWLPGVAGFVGADTVAMLLAHPLATDDKVRLAIDVGTNGEIVLSANGRLWACSAAAGPAFEGAGIAQGMRAADGAIDHVFITGKQDLGYSTVNGGKAAGICGSGVVDAAAAMFQGGLLSSLGAMVNSGNPLLDARRVSGDGRNAVRLTGPEEKDMVAVTQQDIRHLQLAKAAISAAIRYLLHMAGLSPEDVDEVLLAGAFGNYVKPASALAIGLFPAAFSGKIKLIGNAAGAGAQAALVSRSKRQAAAAVAEEIQYVELAGKPDFQNYYIDAMFLGGEAEEAQ